MLFKILFYIFVYRTARSGSYNLKQITQMESVNYTELATIVFGLSCIIVLLTFGVVYTVIRIGQIQKDFVREDGTLYDYIAQEKKRIDTQVSAQSRTIDLHQRRISGICSVLYKPLYEVGNTIWYNRGVTGESGVHIEHNGIIVDRKLSDTEEPIYIVSGTEGTLHIHVAQSLITAWTN